MQGDGTDLAAVSTIVYLLASFATVAIAIWIVYHLAKKLKDLAMKRGDLFGQAPRVRLISFGVAALFFPEVLRGIFRAVVGSITSLMSELPHWHAESWRQTSSVCQSNSDLGKCIGQLGFDFLEKSGAALAATVRQADLVNFPFWQLVLMLALAALVAQLCEALPLRGETPQHMCPTRRGRTCFSS